MLFAVSESSLAQVSEVDSYERAVTLQTKEDALAFIEEFRSSHLTGDLIESLRPEVAREVCAALPSGVSRARRACEQLRKVPVAEATASSKDVTAGTAQSSAAAAPTQPIETQPIGGMAPAPATAGAVAVAPQIVDPAGGGQSETGAPPTTSAGSTTGAATAAAESAPSSSNLPQSATTSPTPIKSRPVVYVGSNSDADIFAQATDGSAIIGTASRNAPLTVLGRDRNWLKVLVPSMKERAGWVHTSRLQAEDAGGIKVVPAAGTTAPLIISGTNTTAAPATQVASNTASAVAPSATPPSATSAATAAAEGAPSSSDLPQSAAITPPTPIKSKPIVYVRSDSGANILAQATDGSVIIGTASSNAPLTVLGRDRNWLKVHVPGTTNRPGWIHISSLQMDADGIKVDLATGITALPVTPGASTSAVPAMQAASNTVPVTAPSATPPSATSAATATAESAPPSSNLPQPVATPPTPIESRPVVYVRSNSDADIFAQATDGSAIIGTAPRNAPLTVLGRERNWLKVLVPGMTEWAGWVHISRLQMDAGGVKVAPTTGTSAPP